MDVAVVTGSVGVQTSISDGELIAISAIEKQVELFTVDTNKTRSGGSFFPYLNITIFGLPKYGIFKTVGRNN